MTIGTVAVGIDVRSEGRLLHRSVEAVVSHSPEGTQPVLLVNQEATDLVDAAALYQGLILFHSKNEHPAEFFNLLRTSEPYAVIVLLEEGALPAPGWLEPIVAALENDPTCGAIGPSTNVSGDEQTVLPSASGTREGLAQAAMEVSRRFSSETAILESGPQGFCYAVRRAVALEIGEARQVDDGRAGWAQDYNGRLRQRGYRTCWARSSFVYRQPQVAVHEVFSGPRAPHPGAQRDRRTRFHSGADGVTSTDSHPLVSCIMPTRGRADFVGQAVAYYRRQDYESRELIIVYEGPEDLPSGVTANGEIRLIRADGGSSIGAKRNVACNVASGELVMQWDDDDWHASNRISAQVAPILQGHVDITALSGTLFFDLTSNVLWECAPEQYRRMFLEGVHGGTLAFRRSVWERTARYPDRSLREDADFLSSALRKGASLGRIDGRNLYVYLRHQTNSWEFDVGKLDGSRWWSQVEIDPFLPEDRQFYQRFTGQTPDTAPRRPSRPLVSCIMPTRDRVEFVPGAVRNFLDQDYPHKELVILDNGLVSVRNSVPADPAIHYFRCKPGSTIGALRNRACSESAGEIIAHWDDDDWRASDWLQRQVDALQKSGSEACGLDQIFFYDPVQHKAWIYSYPESARPWVCGGTLCYRRSFWERNPFPDVQLGEDSLFLWNAHGVHLAKSDYQEGYVAVIHPGNSSPKDTQGSLWVEVSPESIGAVEKAVLGSRRTLRR